MATNSVFKQADTLHSTVAHHLKFVRDFESVLQETIAAIPDPPETVEKEIQTSHCKLTFDPTTSSEFTETVSLKSTDVTNTGCQTSSNWMASKRTQTSAPFQVQETAMQTTREHLTDGACQTKAPKVATVNAKTQTKASWDGTSTKVSNGHNEHLGFPPKRKNKILSCLRPSSVTDVERDKYQTSTEVAIQHLQNGTVPDRGLSDINEALVQTVPSVISIDHATQTSPDDATSKLRSQMCDASLQTMTDVFDRVSQTVSITSDEIAIQATESVKDGISQTPLPPEIKTASLQTLTDVFDKVSQTVPTESDEIAVQATESVMDGISQTPLPPEIKTASLQTTREFSSDASLQTTRDVCDEVSQTMYIKSDEISVQATESVMDGMSQTPLPPNMKEASLQTTREFCSDVSLQTLTDVFDKVSQTLYIESDEIAVQATESVIDGISQTPLPPEMKTASLQTLTDAFDKVSQTVPIESDEIAVQATESVIDGISQTPLPPEMKTASLQTTREFSSDASLQTTRDVCDEVSQTLNIESDEIAVQATESVMDGISQTPLPPEIKAASLQTTREFLVDVSAQTLIPNLNEQTTQTLLKQLVDGQTQTVKAFKSSMTQTLAPPDVKQVTVQTSREYVQDANSQTPSPPSCENTGMQTQAKNVSEKSMQTHQSCDTIGIQTFISDVKDVSVQTEEPEEGFLSMVASRIFFK